MGQTSADGNLDEPTLKHLIEMINENNCLPKIFRRARDHYESVGLEFVIRLLPDKGKGKEYDLPSTSEVAGLIVGDMSSTIGVRDIVVQFQSDTLQQNVMITLYTWAYNILSFFHMVSMGFTQRSHYILRHALQEQGNS